METRRSEKLYTLSALAEASGFRLRTVQKHAEQGVIKTRLVGRSRVRRVPESEFKKYIGEGNGQ